jgi:hypothetical protein
MNLLKKSWKFWVGLVALCLGLLMLLKHFLRIPTGGTGGTFQVLKSGPGGDVADFKKSLKNSLNVGGYNSSYYAFWFAVARLECASFTSNLWVRYYNPWGMNQPKIRKTTSMGPTNNKFEGMSKASYSSPESAALDIIYYMDEFKYPKQGFEDYWDFIQFMKSKGYFGISAKDYFDRSKGFLNSEMV